MKNIIKIITENLKLFLILLISALIAGFFIGKSTNQHANQDVHQLESAHQHIDEKTNQVWTCSMHPQIKQDKPGLCPICGMDLIPLTTMTSSENDVHPNEIAMSESAAKLASIQTLIVGKGVPKKTVYLQGKIQADERNIALITTRFGGRIEKLFVNFTGQQVKKGEKLATIYSPALLTAQKELLEAISFKESRPSIYIASKAKLKLWDLSDDQISTIEDKGEPQVYFDILSPISGTVSMRNVSIGDYVKEGNPLFKVIDLNKVWAIFDAYESDLPWIKTGDKIEFTIQSLPGAEFSSPITFIDPFINPQTRVTSIRVEVNNSDHKLKPEMFISGTLNSKIEGGQQILIPKSAALWTGKRAVVYVKVPDRESPTFLYREIILGADAGAFYIVEEGLAVGEEIAINGVFKIDAASQLQGLQSMMNPEGGTVSSGSMPGMDMKTEPAIAANITHQNINVAGNCEMCKDRIETAAQSIKGVQNANWSIEKKTLHLSYDKTLTSSDEIQKAIAKAGHDTEKFKADDSVYSKLPACCLYERMKY